MQRPERRALEHDEDAIARWVKNDWPRIRQNARRRGARLAVHPQLGSYDDQVLIGVLGQLRRFLGGQKVTLLWDGLPSHRSRRMHAFITSQRGWLVVERLPAYAPELNPVEGLWANLKDQEFANYAADTFQDLTHTARGGVRRIRRRPRLLFAFLDRTELSL